MKTILILTDFSASATHAAKFAIGQVKKLGTTKIILYHTHVLPEQEMIMVTDVLVGSANGAHALYQESLIGLNELKEQLLPELGADVQLDILSDEEPLLRGVKSIVLEHKVDLVVAGVSGSHDNGANSIGKNTIQILREESFPTLIVPLGAVLKPLSKLMFACDLRYITGLTPFDQINKFCKNMGSNLDAVNIDYEESKGAANMLEAESLLHRGLESSDPVFHYLRDKNIVGSLLKFAETNGNDLIIAVPRKLGFLERLFHESATKKLAIDTKLPLLILHQNKTI